MYLSALYTARFFFYLRHQVLSEVCELKRYWHMLYLVHTHYLEFPKEWPERWPVDHYSSLFCTIHKSMFSIFLLQHNLKCRRSTFYSIKRRLTANNVLHNIIFIVQKIFKIINICNILPLRYYYCLNKIGIRDIYEWKS